VTATDAQQSTSSVSRGKRIGLFVIAYNAVNKLDWTLDRIPKEVWDKVEEVFLFDDCSTDNTYYAAVGYKSVKGIQKLTVHRNASNLRYGGNQKAGYQYAIARGHRGTGRTPPRPGRASRRRYRARTKRR